MIIEPWLAKEKPPAPERAPDTADEVHDDDRHARHRIRCPLCMWVPKASSRWACYCGHSWNTFDTGGVADAEPAAASRRMTARRNARRMRGW